MQYNQFLSFSEMEELGALREVEEAAIAEAEAAAMEAANAAAGLFEFEEESANLDPIYEKSGSGKNIAYFGGDIGLEKISSHIQE